MEEFFLRSYVNIEHSAAGLLHLLREDADRWLQDAAVGRLPGHRGILPLRAGRGALGGAATLGDTLIRSVVQASWRSKRNSVGGYFLASRSMNFVLVSDHPVPRGDHDTRRP